MSNKIQDTLSAVRSQSNAASKQSLLLHSSISISKQYKEYGYRWVILSCFTIAVLVNGIAYDTFVPNALQFVTIYGTNESITSLTATIYMLMHPIFTFFASVVIVKKGFATSVQIGCICTIIGFAIRLLVNTNFNLVLIGQIFCGMGRPFIMNAQASMSQNWFYAGKRTAILTFCNIIGTFSIVLSLMIPANIVFVNYDIANDENRKPEDTIEKGEELTMKLMWLEFLISLILIPCFFLLKNQAPTPPSGFAGTDINIPFKDAVVQLFKIKNFVLVLVPFSLYFGSFKGFGIIVTFLMKPFGFKDSQVSLTGSMTILGGVVSSLVTPTLVKKFKNQKYNCIFLMFVSIFFSGLFYFSLDTNNINVVFANAFALGFFLVPLVPIMLEYSCEAIYPLNGSFAVGLMLSGATLMTVCITQLLTVIVKGKDARRTEVAQTLGTTIAILFVGFIVFFFTSQVKNRSKEVAQRKEQNKSVFFKASELKQSVMDEIKEGSTKPQYGDFPTEHPIIAPEKFISNPEVFDPDNIVNLED